MEYGPISFYAIFIAVVVLGGSLGGLLQAMRSTSSYKFRKPKFKSASSAAPEYWDLGGFGVILAGVISAFMAIGVLTMAGAADFSPVSKYAFKSYQNGEHDSHHQNNDEILIPVAMFSSAHNDNAVEINRIIKVVVEHNLKRENDSITGSDKAFWTWIKIFSFSILSGFGGVGLVSSAYKRYVGEDEFNDIQQKVKEEYEIARKNTVEIALQRARELIANTQYDEAIKVCDDILTNIHPNHARAIGIKARALSRDGKLAEAIKLLESALSISDMSESVRARMHWNIACYQTRIDFSEGLPEELDCMVRTLGEIRSHLERAIALDEHLRLKLPDGESDLIVLKSLSARGQDWFDNLVRAQ
ncbi:tetratricopeptide repeat protein [Pseudoalteromonas piscicida]